MASLDLPPPEPPPVPGGLERPAIIDPIPTEWNHPQEVYDWMYLQFGRVTAQFLRRDREILVGVRANLVRWMKQTQERNHHNAAQILNSARREWLHIIDTYSTDQIAAVLEDRSHEGQRLRSSRPFGGPGLFGEWLKPFQKEVFKQLDLAAIAYKRKIQAEIHSAKTR